MSRQYFLSSRRGYWGATGYLATLPGLIVPANPAVASSTISSSEPMLTQNPSSFTLVTKSRHAMQTAGVSLTFKHLSEVLSREGPEAKAPLMGSLSDFGIRWPPRGLRPLPALA